MAYPPPPAYCGGTLSHPTPRGGPGAQPSSQAIQEATEKFSLSLSLSPTARARPRKPVLSG